MSKKQDKRKAAKVSNGNVSNSQLLNKANGNRDAISNDDNNHRHSKLDIEYKEEDTKNVSHELAITRSRKINSEKFEEFLEKQKEVKDIDVYLKGLRKEPALIREIVSKSDKNEDKRGKLVDFFLTPVVLKTFDFSKSHVLGQNKFRNALDMLIELSKDSHYDAKKWLSFKIDFWEEHSGLKGGFLSFDPEGRVGANKGREKQQKASKFEKTELSKIMKNSKLRKDRDFKQLLHETCDVESNDYDKGRQLVSKKNVPRLSELVVRKNTLNNLERELKNSLLDKGLQRRVKLEEKLAKKETRLAIVANKIRLKAEKHKRKSIAGHLRAQALKQSAEGHELIEFKKEISFEEIYEKMGTGLNYSLRKFIELVQSSGMNERDIDFFITLTSSCYLITRSVVYADSIGLGASIYSLLSQFTNNIKIKLSISAVSSVANFLTSTVTWLMKKEVQILEDEKRNWMDSIEYFVSNVFSSAVTKIIAGVIGVLTSLKLFGKTDASIMQYFMGRFNVPQTFPELLQSIMKVISQMGEFFSVWISQGLMAALQSRDKVDGIVTEMSYLITNSTQLYTGLPVRGKISEEEYLDRSSRILDVAIDYLKVMAKSHFNYDKLLSLKVKLTENFDALQAKRNSENRIAPFAIMIPGPPGIGKSTIVNLFYYIMGRVRGRAFHPSQVYPRNIDSEYWEGFDGIRHPYICYTEIGNESSNIAKNQIDPAIKELNSVIDCQAYCPNMAALEGKGKNYMHPWLVTLITNNESLNLQWNTNNPSAYERRFIYVDMEVREHLRKEGSLSLDPEKVSKANLVNPYDAWTFSVRRKVPSEKAGFKSNNVWLKRNVDWAEMVQFMAELMKAHIETQVKAKKRFNHPGDILDSFSFDNIEMDASLLEESDLLQSAHIARMSKGMNGVDIMISSTKDLYKSLAARTKSICEKFKLTGNRNITKRANTLDCSQELYNYDENVEYKLVPFTEEESIGIVIPSIDDSSDVDAEGFYNCEWESSAELQDISFNTDSEEDDDIKREGKEEEIHSADNEQMYDFINGLFSDISEGEYIQFTKRKGCFEFSNCVPMGHLDDRLAKPIFVSNKDKITSICIKTIKIIKQTGESVITFYEDQVNLFCAIFHEKMLAETMFVMGIWYFSDTLPFELSFIAKVTSAMFLISRYASVHLKPTFTRIKDTFIKKSLTSYYERTKKSVCSLGNMLTNTKTKKLALGTAATLTAGVITIASLLKFFSNKKLQNMKNEDGEIKAEQLPTHWQVNNIADRAVFLSGISQLENRVRRNTVSIRVTAYNEIKRKEVAYQFHGFGLYDDFALINTHCAYDGKWAYSRRPYDWLNAVHLTGIIKKIDLGSDLTLVRLRGIQFMDIRDDISLEGKVGDYPTIVIDNHTSCATLEKNKVLDNTHYETLIFYSYPKHMDGSCGLPIIRMTESNGCEIIALHGLGSTNEKSNRAGGIVFSKKTIDIPYIKELGTLLISPSSENILVPELLDHHPKSVCNFEYMPHVEAIGRVPGEIHVNAKSKLLKSSLSKTPEFLSMIERLHYVDNIHYGKPIMQPLWRDGQYISPYNIAARKIGKLRPNLDIVKLESVVSVLLDNILPQIKPLSYRPLTTTEAINGKTTNKWFRKMNMATSAGYGLKGKKRDHFLEDEKGIFHPTEELNLKLVEMEESCKKGICGTSIFSAKLKDEPRPSEKIKEGKTRLFYMQDLATLILSRKYLAPFYALLSDQNRIFGSRAGCNIYTESEQFYYDMRKFDNFIEYDFSSYDITMPYDIAWAASTFVYKFIESKLDYTETELTVVRTLLTMGMFPILEINKELYIAPGIQCSGKYGTLEDNCVKGLIMLQYYWMFYLCKNSVILDECCINIAGDDNAHGAMNKDSDFNALTFGNFCKEILDMTCTSATKGDIEGPFVELEDLTFLKRTFVYHNYKWRGRLSLDSIVRTLTWILPSSSISAYEHDLSRYTSVLYELWLHLDKEEFEIWKEYLSAQLPDTMQLSVPSWERIQLTMDPECPASITIMEEELCLPTTYQIISDLSNDDIIEGMGTEILLDNLINVVDMPLIKQSLSEDKIQQITETEIKIVTSRIKQVDTVKERKNLEKRLKQLTDRLNWGTNYRKESGIGDTTSGNIDSSAESKFEVVEDVGGDTPYEDDVYHQRPLGFFKPVSVELGKFLERPVLIQTLSWAYGEQHYNEIDPYVTFLNNSLVRIKLGNYSLIRCNLMVRIAMSANQFDSGRVLATWVPRTVHNPVYQQLVSYPTSEAMTGYLSQFMGSIVIDIKSNKPVDMRLPFVMQYPVMRLYNETDGIVADSDNLVDTTNIGLLILKTIESINSADPSHDLQIQVYAWATDVELGCPTNTILGVKMESDEREIGPVEEYSTLMADVAGKLKKVPYIGPYAMASTMFLKGIANIAALFGWSRPNIIDNVMIIKNEPFQNGSVSIIADVSHKLTLDPKQEITVDPSFVGVNADELVIEKMANVNSYIGTFTWDINAAPQTFIASIPVTPGLGANSILEDSYVITPAAVTYASMPFDFWHGDLEFTFDFHTTSFTRGKILFSYEPTVYQGALGIVYNHLNSRFTTIVDMQETQTITIKVKWAQNIPWLRVPDTTHIRSINLLNTPVHSDLNGYCNGVLNISPFTKLNNNDGSDVYFDVYVKGSNWKVNRPDYNNLNGYATHIGSLSEFKQEGFCESVSTITINDMATDDSDICVDYFGERPVSFRSLLKREFVTDISEASFTNSTAAGNFIKYQGWVYPKNKIPYSDTTLYTTRSVFDYLRNAFMCMRGSMRKRLLVSGTDNWYNAGGVIVSNDYQGNIVTFDPPSIVASSELFPRGANTLFVQRTNCGIEFDIPFYTNALFVNTDNPANQDLSYMTWNGQYDVQFDEKTLTTNPINVRVIELSIIGEDFGFYRWLSSPYMVLP